MEGNKLLTMLVTITICIIFIGALLAPVISEQTDHTAVLHNDEGLDSATRPYTFADDTPVTFGCDDEGYYVNEDHFLQLSANYATITSDGIVIRQGSGGGALAAYVPELNESYTPPYSFTAANGTITGTVLVEGVETTMTASYTYLYYQDYDGDYVMTGVNPGNFYLMGDSDYYCSGYNTSLGSGITRWFFMSGTIDDGFTFKYGNNTITDYTLNATKLDGYVEDVYEVTSIVFHISESLDITVNRGIAPAEIQVTEVSDTTVDSLLMVIPLMAIAALVLLVVRYFVAGRD